MALVIDAVSGSPGVSSQQILVKPIRCGTSHLFHSSWLFKQVSRSGNEDEALVFAAQLVQRLSIEKYNLGVFGTYEEQD
jgi:hypothetical protein